MLAYVILLGSDLPLSPCVLGRSSEIVNVASGESNSRSFGGTAKWVFKKIDSKSLQKSPISSKERGRQKEEGGMQKRS